ncbi:IclR family transcriptional regulator [Pseudonocardia sediminis]|uniref:IclR family transcriptional regulator n=1 Tax=Pseudonocardia sediminis TaxID=1397368 RepID=A0A4Q7V0W1_PSEST|nr:IclR family transcriptional regulator [Pseudonocardia sediminis]RZT87064.1 IclR family transcriptional regulator [Pseudonocardia sediminis]
MSGVPALRRGLAVLRLLAAHSGPMPAATLASLLGLPRSTMYHLLTELEAAGFVVHLPEQQRYGLGLAAFEVGSAYLRHDPLDRLAAPILRRLVERVGHDAHLGVLHGRELLYLLRERPARPEGLVTAVGVRLPAHLTASGRAVLAGTGRAQLRALLSTGAPLQRRTDRGPASLRALHSALAAERRRGWSCEDGEVSPGFASVACPVLGPDGHAVASVSVTFRHLCDPACGRTWPELAGHVHRTAHEITRRLGGAAAGGSGVRQPDPA